jgi:hemerythrin-like metal-binding protein
MNSIKWNESLSVGLKQFDKDHAHLFDILDRIYTVSMGNNHATGLEPIIDELIDYANYHFTSEEHLLKVSDYPELASQEIEHEHFIFRALEFKRDLINGNNPSATILIWFLGNWLLHHIMDVDKKYCQHLKSVDMSKLNF